tara:strand:- start:105 stop:545 length:441 start_codon:yes stop_codon:yes gene_type:complete
MPITWKKDSFQAEYYEFKRVADEASPNPKAARENLNYLKLQYGKSSKVALNDTVWSKLGNTGSWNVKTLDDLFSNLRSDGIKRDVSRIVTQFIGTGVVNNYNGNVSCPIIIEYADKYCEVVAGNTRLTMCRILNIQPYVVNIKTDW